MNQTKMFQILLKEKTLQMAQLLKVMIIISIKLMSQLDLEMNNFFVAGCYSIIVDEAKCNRKELLGICVRYTKGSVPVERFLCFKNCSEDRSANGLYTLICSTLRENNIYNIPILSQAYDGASVMSGDLTGLKQEF